MHFITKWAVASLTLATFGATFCQGLPVAEGPRACHMDDNQGHRVDFNLTVGPHAMILDLGGGKVYPFPLNASLTDSSMAVGAVSEPGRGSVSILLDRETGKFQQTFLLPGQPIEFVYGECRP